MTTELRSPGQTTVAPDVLLAIARLTTLKIEGVHAMGKAPLWAREFHTGDGVQALIEGGHADLDLFLILDHEVNLRQVGREVQTQVTRAISEMVGMQPGRVNIHIEDIYFPPTAATAAA
jgi:uncharacterized alkaline shock family protein YloU